MYVRGILSVLAVLLPSAMQAQPTQQALRDECDLGAPKVCVRHVIEDEVGIVKSPLHVRTKDLLWIVPFGVATGVAIHYDAEALNELGHDPSRQNTFDQISNVGAVYIPIAGIVGGYAAGSWRKDDYLRQTAVLSGEAILDAQIINLPLKYAIDRQTPDQGDGTGRFWPHGPSTWPDGQSMPSGHSLTAWSFAHVIAARYPSWHTRLLMYGLATTVSVSRVMARQHFPSDVLVGGALGYFVGGYVVGRRGEVSRRFSFSMVNTPNGRGAQLSYNFGN